MSKLLLSTSMVVALMAIGSNLSAEEVTFDEIKEPAAVSTDEANIASDSKEVQTEEKAADQEMEMLQSEEKKIADDTNLTAEEKKEIDDSINALEDVHKLFDEAIQSAEEQKDDPEAQKAAFEEVDKAAQKVSEETIKLTDLLNKDDQKDPEVIEIEKDVLSESGDVKADQAAEDTVAQLEENLEGAVASENPEITKDANLTPAEIQQIDEESAKNAKAVADKITASLNAAEEMKKGLQDAGLDPSDENVLKLKAALANLKSILDGLFPELKGKAVTRK